MTETGSEFLYAMTRNDRFKQILERFPKSIHEYLETILENRGMLAAGPFRGVRDELKIAADDLMLKLLPIARLYSRSAISGFQVGAVVKANASEESDETALFLGANIEFPGQALSQTVHAEQSAVINAWLQGARQIESIAVTAAPCGCCRQFLYELEGSQHLTVLLQKPSDEKSLNYDLADLLPQAFGPQDLRVEGGLIRPPTRPPKLNLKSEFKDQLVRSALAAARSSYAPYSQNLAGCAIQTGSNKIYTGPYAENAAFNPSLSPLHTAAICMMMDHFGTDFRITRAVLVEKPTSINQRNVCEQLLQTAAPGVVLEFFEAQ
jgi:cytidine deaminase